MVVKKYTALRAPENATGGTTAIAVGSSKLDDFSDAVFKVNYAGEMTATAGTIANWTITQKSLICSK